MEKRCIFWDWNGTLVDDLQIALRAVNRILSVRNRPPISKEEYLSYIDTPIIRFYEKLFDLKKEPFLELAQEFNRYYNTFLSDGKLHAGVRDRLKYFEEKRVRQVVLSSSSTEDIRRQAAHFEILPYFNAILGADNLLSESKVQRGLSYLKSENLKPCNCWVIGDTTHDFAVSKEMGCDCILFTGGHQSKEQLKGCSARIVEHLKEISL